MKNLERCLAISLFACAHLLGQGINGTIRGTVTDPSGAVIPKVNITVTNTDKNAVVRTLVTGGEGQYTAPLIPIGHYSVSAAAPGFKTLVIDQIIVNANDELTIDLKLLVGGNIDSVSVEAGAVQVDTESPTAAGLFTTRQVLELPTNNRNYEQFVGIAAPGISAGTADQIYVGVTSPSGLSNQINFSINGNRPTQNNWTVDGADNVDRGANLTLLNYPSIDSIDEFKVLRGQYNPEFGRSSAGQINVITKSGSSQFHGDAYEFFRNNLLNANNYFNNLNGISRPALHYNNFGWTLGGPVFIPGVYNKDRNKTFFFFSEEFRRVITYSDFSSGEVPTPAELAGSFAAPVCLSADCSATGTQIPNISPTAQAYIKDVFARLPAATVDPNTGVPDYNFVGRNVFNFRQESIKIDQYFGQKVVLSARYLTDNIPTQEPGGLFTGSALPGVSTTSTNSPGHNLVIRATTTLTPSLINETGYAWSYGAVVSTPTGLDSSTRSPDVKPGLPFHVQLNRIPDLQFGNGESVVGFGAYKDYNRNHNLFDTLSWVKGNHSMKFGFTYNHYQKDENSGGSNTGQFYFDSTDPNGNSTFQQEFANFLQGRVLQYIQLNIDPRAVINQNQTELYAQDQWRVRRNLTVSYGLRYSLFFQPTDGNNRLASFDPATYNPANAPKIDSSGNLVAGTQTPVLNGVIINGKNSPYGNAIASTTKRDFAPRIGVAWDPFGSGKTSVRAGYGIFFDSPSVGVVEQNVLNNPPFVNNVSISNTTLDNPGGVAADVNLSPLALYATQPDWKLPYTEEWSFDVQRQLLHGTILDVGYYGAKGVHLIGVVDINEPYPDAYLSAGLVGPGKVITGGTTPRLNQIRPYLGYDAINMFSTRFNSNYHSLQTQVTQRFGGGNTLVVNYTWSHALTDAQSDYRTPQNTYNIHADYGSSQFDRRHIFNANWVYELPFFKNQKGFAGEFLGGWEVSGVLIAQTGLPLTVTGGKRVDPAGLGLLDALSFAGRRPDIVGDPNAGAPHTRQQWFNKSAFANIPAGVFRPGDAPRGAVAGPGTTRVDLGLFKTFRIVERVNCQFRAEAFNAFNHVNWDSISTSLASSLFGRVTSARDPRIWQLGLKMKF